MINVILPQPKEIAPLLELLQRLPFWDEFSIFPGCFRVWFLGLSPLPLLQTRAVVQVVSFFAFSQPGPRILVDSCLVKSLYSVHEVMVWKTSIAISCVV